MEIRQSLGWGVDRHDTYAFWYTPSQVTLNEMNVAVSYQVSGTWYSLHTWCLVPGTSMCLPPFAAFGCAKVPRPILSRSTAVLHLFRRYSQGATVRRTEQIAAAAVYIPGINRSVSSRHQKRGITTSRLFWTLVSVACVRTMYSTHVIRTAHGRRTQCTHEFM